MVRRLWAALMRRLHLATARYCNSHCGCYEWGYESAQYNVSEWNRP
jgi:hypothetical protein